jgi:hypothetical protein
MLALDYLGLFTNYMEEQEPLVLDNLALFSSKIQNSKSVTVKLAAHSWSTKCRRNKKLIAQFAWKLRDERFEPN